MARHNIFVDMDGVLAVYDPEAYMTDPQTGLMPFENLTSHYFAHCEPDILACRLFEHLFRSDDVSVRVLSTTTGNGDALRSRLDDKLGWLADNLSCFSCTEEIAATFIPTCPEEKDSQRTKPATAQAVLGRPLEKTDILIDDFNGNLAAWEAAGGTAVKYLNGINSPTDLYPCLSMSKHSVQDVLMELMAIIERTTKEQAAREIIEREGIVCTNPLSQSGAPLLVVRNTTYSTDGKTHPQLSVEVRRTLDGAPQDVCVIEPSSLFEGVRALVWGDPESEDFTDDFDISFSFED